MLDTPQPLTSSASFSGTPSKVAVERPLKRHLTSTDLSFFTPAATSFKPRPYVPKESTPRQTRQLPPPSHHLRSFDAVSAPMLDPSPSDPNTVFIHPPFTDFPGADLIPEGLSYLVMAANPEWFFDPKDFISPANTNPNAIPYPPHLEPPRGWCPAKKKDLRDRVANSWPEGEEPRLRCTFCRRTYAGVNAKSMWRRHVFEKHKIAMSNRRDGRERHRGRGKENKGTAIGQGRDQSMKFLKMDLVQRDLQPHPLKSDGRSFLPGEARRDINSKANEKNSPVSQQLSDFLCHNLSQPYPFSQPVSPPVDRTHTPPLHYPPTTSDVAHSPLETVVSTSSPLLLQPVLPHSPYDPLQTPSFRHSPLRLPSDQPWRFPSPSHPLYSKEHDLCLTMLAPTTITPLMKSSVMNTSPIRPSPLSIPSASIFCSSDTVLVTKVDTEIKAQVADSPFRKHTSGISVGPSHNKGHLRSLSDVTDDWPSDESSGIDPRALLQDPFTELYDSWLDMDSGEKFLAQESSISIFPGSEVESPVLRSTAGANIFEESPIVRDASKMWSVDLKGGGDVQDVQAPSDSQFSTNVQCRKRYLDATPSRTKKTKRCCRD